MLKFISNKHLKEVFRGSVLAFILKAFGAVLAFAFNIFLANILGVEGTGQYFLIISILTIVAVFGKFGLDNSLLFYVSKFRSLQEWGSIKPMVKRCYIYAVMFSLFLMGLLYSGSSWLSVQVFNKPEISGLLKFGAILVLPLVLNGLGIEHLKAHKKFVYSQFLQVVSIPLISIVLIYFLANNWKVNGALIVFGIAVTFSACLGGVIGNNETRLWKGLAESPFKGNILKSSVPFFWLSVMNLTTNWSGTIFLGVWASSSDVGIFSVANKTAMLLGFIINSVNIVVAPKFSELYYTGEKQALSYVAKKSARMMMLIAAPIVLIFILFPDMILNLYGDGFSDGAFCLQVLAIGQFVNVSAGSVGYLLLMTDNKVVASKNATVCFFVNIGLFLALVPYYGLKGAALAATLSLVVKNVLLVGLVKKHLGINFLGRDLA